MTLLTVEQAAIRLKKTPRTIRRWIEKENKLKATHPTHGHTTKYLIPEEEVTRLIADIAKEQPEQEQGPGPASEDITKRLELVEHWIHDLQRWHEELDARTKALEQGVSLLLTSDGEASFSPLKSHTEPLKKGRPAGNVRPVEPPAEIPSGSVGLTAFAELHHVNERTARDQVDQNKIPAFVRARPSNPRFKERWLRPEDQQAAIQFWQSHETSGFTSCSECPHEKNEALESP